MYPALLATRYLTSRVIPLVAVGAVALCVALVIIVVSVMTGFLDLVKNSGRTLMGDVVISYPVRGIGWYDRLVEELEATEGVAAATPVVDGWGLLKMPYPPGRRKETETVQFWAVDPGSFARVTGYADTLYWRAATESERAKMTDTDFRRDLEDALGAESLDRRRLEGLELRRGTERDPDAPGICLGIHVSQANERQHDGSYRPVGGGLWWMPQYELVLTALPADVAAVSPQPESVSLAVVNEFMSGVYLIDEKRVIVPLEVGQRLLHLDGAELVDDEGVSTGFADPARATMVLVRAIEGVTADELRDRVVAAFERFRDELSLDPLVDPRTIPPPVEFGLRIQTWREQQARFLDPIEKERELMRTLFSLVYLVCAGLVLSIFWAIVYEKTRDIGILRSVGASRLGIAMIFIRYGLVIGVLGAIAGLGLAALVVGKINTIHSAMGDPPLWLAGASGGMALLSLLITIIRARTGRLLPIVLGILATFVFVAVGAAVWIGHRLGGVVIWDPSVYYFAEIPNELDLVTAATTMVGAVIFSVLGAFFPAAKAADVDPVQALRYE